MNTAIPLKAWRTTIADSEFYLIGDSAIVTVGDLNGNDGVSTERYPYETTIVRNHIHEVGVTGKQTAALFSATSGRTTFANNVAYNGTVVCCERIDFARGCDSVLRMYLAMKTMIGSYV
jgi:hypothetical protein